MHSSYIHRRIRPLATCAGACLALAVAGCGESDSESSSESSSSGQNTEGVAYAKAELAKYTDLVTDFKAPGPTLDAQKVKSKLQGKTVWYIPVFLEAPIFSANAKALVEPLRLMGAKVKVCDAAANPSQGSSCVKQAVAAKAAGIITDAIDFSFAAQAQASALKAGIPIVATDNDNAGDFPDDPNVQTVGIGVPKTARLAVDYIIADSGGKANALYASNSSDAGKIHAKATLDEFKQRCPGCKVTVVNYGDLTLQRLPTAVSAAMVKNPKINYVYGGYDAPAGIFALQGAKQVTGRKFKYVTITGQPPGLQRLAAGQQEAVPGTDTVTAMWNTSDALFRIVAGEEPIESYTPALRVFTKDNVPSDTKSADAYASGRWYTNGGFRPVYRKAWGL